MTLSRIWIDVEDLLIYGTWGLRPSGIQRLEFELCRALIGLPQSEGRIFFVRHDTERRNFVAVPWEVVEATYNAMASERTVAPVVRPPSIFKLTLKKAIYALPDSLRQIVWLQLGVFLAVVHLACRRAAHISKVPQRPRPAFNAGTTDYFASNARPGDVLAVLGSPWAPGYFAYIERAVRERKLHLALLIYDIIPLRRPEWVDIGNMTVFRAWFDGAISLADTIFTISAATAKDVVCYARHKALKLRAVPAPIPIGTGFKGMKRQMNGGPSHCLPSPNSYVLIVSTIEARKNHALLVAVWRRLLEDMPAAKVPTLVFAGRVGWLVSDLMQQLRNCNFLDGKIIHIESPTDEDLETLYDGCLFTLFPSFYEGWGLPVTESLAFGRPCIISNTTSLPEAGGSLARYIDPDNTTDAYRVVRETIEDRAGLREWRNRVRCEFRPVEWSQSARAMLKMLDTIGDASSTRETELQHCA